MEECCRRGEIEARKSEECGRCSDVEACRYGGLEARYTCSYVEAWRHGDMEVGRRTVSVARWEAWRYEVWRSGGAL